MLESCSWCNHLAAKIFAGAPCVQELLLRLRSDLTGETHNFLQLIRSLYPTNLLLSFRNTLSLHRHFLTATLSFIDRGCYLEKQRKKEEEDGQERGDGQAGKKRNKSLASKAYEITECPLISRAWLLFRKCKHSHWKSISFLFSKNSSYFRQ